LVAAAEHPASVVIAPANWRDWSAVMKLEKLCFGRDAWSALDVAAALIFPDTVRLKAVLDEDMIGLVVGDVRRREQTGWIATIAVHPSHRRRGLGRRLLRTCEQAMAMPRVKLTLRASNKPAYDLYRQEGYEQLQYWRGYYAGGEDAIVMEKILI
jgi:ribosomal-protein-alanine N-acetyltransferase